ncbi:MAG: tyrosine-protein phosphatase [Acidobacteriota bacterium]
MHASTRAPVFVLCIFLFFLGTTGRTGAQTSSDFPKKALPRFYQVNETLFRGGMPKEEGFRYLKQMGIKTIVNFRNDNDERQLVESLGMRHVHIPLTATRGISDYSIQEFFKALNSAGNQPVFVHCQRGADRTGAMIAFYRIAFEGWDPERAYKEAREIGLRWWYFKLKKQIRMFDPAPFSEIIPSG